MTGKVDPVGVARALVEVHERYYPEDQVDIAALRALCRVVLAAAEVIKWDVPTKDMTEETMTRFDDAMVALEKALEGEE